MIIEISCVITYLLYSRWRSLALSSFFIVFFLQISILRYVLFLFLFLRVKRPVLVIPFLSALGLLLSWCSLSVDSTSVATGDVVASVASSSFVGVCGLKIYTPALHSAILSNVPVIFSGVIDNTDSQSLGCQRTMFEWQAGTAQLYYQNGTVWWPIGVPHIIQVDNWMTTGPEPFMVSIAFNNTNVWFQPGTPMKVVFTEENPSGWTPDIFEFPLVLQ